jgi:hypothetical protein
VFTARYVLSPYIKQITFRLERVKEEMQHGGWLGTLVDMWAEE